MVSTEVPYKLARNHCNVDKSPLVEAKTHPTSNALTKFMFPSIQFENVAETCQ